MMINGPKRLIIIGSLLRPTRKKENMTTFESMKILGLKLDK